jgi:putative (di)nucleoside polyphosphate hydrolase
MTLALACTDAPLARLPVRPCAGIALFNAQGQIWVGRRRPKWARGHQDYIDDHIWQLPQGGIDKGERPRNAAFRELWEETGITSATILAEMPGWLSYELPRDLLGIALKGRFGGQRLRWFAMSFEGDDAEIDIEPKGRLKAEFDAWRWADIDELPQLAVSFKRPVYEAVASHFAPYARRQLPRAAAS